MRRWEDLRPELDARGIQLLTVSTDTPETLRSQRGKHGSKAVMLSDPDLVVTDRYGLRNPTNITPMGIQGMPIPTTLLVDAEGDRALEGPGDQLPGALAPRPGAGSDPSTSERLGSPRDRAASDPVLSAEETGMTHPTSLLLRLALALCLAALASPRAPSPWPEVTTPSPHGPSRSRPIAWTRPPWMPPWPPIARPWPPSPSASTFGGACCARFTTAETSHESRPRRRSKRSARPPPWPRRASDVLAERLGGDALHALPASEQRARLAEARVSERDAAELYFWSAVAWGAWSREAGLLQSVRKGVANRAHDYAVVSARLDPTVERGGAHRLLARLHAALPKVPFVSGSWIASRPSPRPRPPSVSRPTTPATASCSRSPCSSSHPSGRKRRERSSTGPSRQSPAPSCWPRDLATQRLARKARAQLNGAAVATAN